MEENAAPSESTGLARLFAVHRMELRRFIAARAGSDDTADDLLQELWLKAAASPSGPIANGRAYLFRMANNLVLDAVRARHRRMARDRRWSAQDELGEVAVDDRPDPSESAEDALARKQEAALLGKAIDQLPPGAQRALRLHRLEQLSQDEVARIMGISRSGVEKHLAVAMKHLRAALADCGWYGPAASASRKTSACGEVRGDIEP